MGGEFRVLWAASAAALALAVSGCDIGPDDRSADGKEIVLAEVNGEAITRKDLLGLVLTERKKVLPAGIGKDALRSLVEELVDRRLMLQRVREGEESVDELEVRQYVEAVAQGYGSGRFEEVLREEGIDEEQWRRGIREMLLIERVLQREVYSKATASEEEIRAFYRKNKKKFRLARRWRLRRIVVASKEEAERLRSQILAGVPFSTLASKKSISAERESGGDMGYFSAGELPERIEAVIKHLRGDEVSPVVPISSGYHLIQVTERRSAGIRPFEAVREQIRADILSRKGRILYRQWLSGLRKKAAIRYFWRNLDRVAAG